MSPPQFATQLEIHLKIHTKLIVNLLKWALNGAEMANETRAAYCLLSGIYSKIRVELPVPPLPSKQKAMQIIEATQHTRRGNMSRSRFDRIYAFPRAAQDTTSLATDTAHRHLRVP